MNAMDSNIIAAALSNLLIVAAIIYVIFGALLSTASVIPKRWLRRIMHR
jgi:hypothetical protein